MMNKIGLVVAVVAVVGLSASCSKDGGVGGGASTADSTVGGTLASVTVASAGPIGALSTKTITHVMAVSPATGKNTTKVAAVGSDGKFAMSLDSGKPYLIVFVAQDGVLTGPDMIVGIVRVAANGLDTLPLAQAANVNLGTVSVNSGTATATPSTAVSDLLATLGVTSAEASYIGGIDDLALRLANPDIDGNGVIDASENKSFGLDWHVRANTKLSGADMTLDQIVNTYANPANLSLLWANGSAYAMYPSTLAGNNFVASSGVSTNLQNGGAFTHAGSSINHTTFSNGPCSDVCSFGPDFSMMSGAELGASDAAATFVYTLGTPTKRLTYSNVKTKTVATLNADGTMLPFVKLNVASGKITGITYKWMKKSGATWIDASPKEVLLTVQPQGAFLALYTSKSSSTFTSINFKIPASSQTGTINIGDSNFLNSGVANPSNLGVADVCNLAMSYDDEMGLRLFAGAPTVATGVTLCN